MDVFDLRDFREATLRVLRWTELQSAGYGFLDGKSFDSSSLPGARSKAYSGTRRRVANRVMLHVTGPTTGFGVARYQKYRYRKPEMIPEPFRIQLEGAGVPEDKWPYIAALAHRYHTGTPYFEIGSQAAGWIFANKTLDLWTVHGQGTRTSGGNSGYAIALDGGPKTELTKWIIETWRATIYSFHARWLAAKKQEAIDFGEDPERLFELQTVMHSQAKWPGRAQDTPNHINREVIRPVVDSLPGMYLDESWHYKTGRPLEDRKWY